MRFIRCRYRNEIMFGLVEDNSVIPFAQQRLLSDLVDQDRIAALQDPARRPAPADHRIPLDSVQPLAPVTAPQKIICIGRNYAEHAEEMGADVADLPVVFSKFANTIADPEQDIPLPGISQQVDYEAELVVVIGKTANHVDKREALQHVLGVCCGNDVSARDWQKGRPGGQWLLGKSFDSFAPIGPSIVTLDEVDLENLDIHLTLNGETMQQANTRSLIFKIDDLVAHVSKFFTLLPGDLLFTGTPAGVGAGRQPPRFLQSGDSVVIEISGLGRLTNRFV